MRVQRGREAQLQRAPVDNPAHFMSHSVTPLLGRQEAIVRRYPEGNLKLAAQMLQREQDQWNEKGKESVVHPIFRNQSAPDLEKVDILAQIVPALCSVWRLDPKVFGWSPRPADGERAEYLADYLDRMRAKLEERRGSEANGPSAETLAAFLVALERSCMLCNQSADFAPVPKGHFSLRVDACESHACPLALSRV